MRVLGDLADKVQYPASSRVNRAGKRVLDIIVAVLGLALFAPVLLIAMGAIWLQDFHSPLYLSWRVGRNGRLFRMVKLRSMIVGAEKTKIDSTSSNDPRLTSIGRTVRASKIDEIAQLWNVLRGDMSLVGPRPNVQRETDLYTPVEQRLLTVKPGVTDIASIVFADLNELLRDSQDPNLDYNQLIRPWKSRLGLLYVDHQSLVLDIYLICLTGVAIVSHKTALAGIQKILVELGADETLRRVALRKEKLVPFPPPGAVKIVTHR